MNIFRKNTSRSKNTENYAAEIYTGATGELTFCLTRA